MRLILSCQDEERSIEASPVLGRKTDSFVDVKDEMKW